MPSVTGSPFDDELRCSAFALVPLFRTPCQPCRRLPIDSTCLRLKTSFSLSPPSLSLFPSSFLTHSVTVYSRFPSRSIPGRVSFPFPHAHFAISLSHSVRSSPFLSIAHPRAKKKSVPRFFSSPFFQPPAPALLPARPFLDTARFRRVSIQRA